MLRILLIPAIAVLSACSLFAQKEASNWYFGDKAGIRFNDTGVTVLTDGEMKAQEGTATVSDKNGNLLFYTNGNSVWNKNHQIMPNGNGLLGHPFATQSAIVIPKPLTNGVYYICTVNDALKNPNIGAHYSEVDMSLNGGLGDITSVKNIPLIGPTDEKITAVKHANGHDIWLLIAERFSDRIHAYLVTSYGISSQATVSNIGTFLNSRIGYMKSSPDGQKLALALNDTILVADFNPTSGLVDNPIHIISKTFPAGNTYSLEFSPNGQYLYTGRTDLRTANYLLQYNLYAGNADSITDSEYRVLKLDINLDAALQLGPDQKIYFTEYAQFYLGVIENPNEAGAASNVNPMAINLGRRCRSGLPTFVQSYFLTKEIQSELVYMCNGEFNFSINDTSSIRKINWDFGDTSASNDTSSQFFPSYAYKIPGKYTVRAILMVGNLPADTVYHTVETLATPTISLFAKDTIEYCEGDSGVLEYNKAGATSYFWNTGETSKKINVNQSGIYSLTIGTDSCSVTDSIYVLFHAKPHVDLGPDSAFCDDFLITPQTNGNSFVWSNGTSTENLLTDKAGTYILKVSDNNSCENADTIHLDKVDYPVAMDKDTVTDCGNMVVLDAENIGASYFWSTGDTSRQIKARKSGTYSVTINNGYCSITDTVTVKLGVNPIADFIEADTLNACEGTDYVLNYSIPGVKSYLWNTGAKTAKLKVNKSGRYSLHVSTDSCSATDSVYVQFYAKPKVYIGPDTAFCDLQGYEIKAQTNGAGYRWNTGDTIKNLFVNKSGTYTLTVQNNPFCKNADTVVVNKVLSPFGLSKDYIRDCGDVVTLDAGNPGATYKWSTGETGRKIQVSQSGKYTVEISNGFCTIKDTVTVKVGENPLKDFIKTDTIHSCEGSEYFLDFSHPEAKTYRWNTGAKSSKITVRKTGLYILHLASDECSGVDSVYVIVHPNPKVYIGPDTAFCDLVNYTLNPDSDGDKYRWNTGDVTKNLHISKAGTYTLRVTSYDFCTAADTVKIDKIHSPFPLAGGEIRECEESVLLDAGNAGAIYTWSTGEKDQKITVRESGLYTVSISNGLCSITDSVEVVFLTKEECESWVFVPNSFSPNGDGLNDEFTLLGNSVQSFNLQIYDRWGEKIFESSDVTKGWTGEYKGQPAPMGVYVYMISYSVPEGKHLKRTNLNGTVQLLR